MYIISCWIYVVLDIQTFCKSKQSVHLLYTISRWIYAILGIQIFYHIQTIHTYNVHNFTLNLCNLYIQCIYRVHIFCKPKKSVHIICSISPLNLRNLGYSNFIQIQTIHKSNVHNFSLDLSNSGHSTSQKSSVFL